MFETLEDDAVWRALANPARRAMLDVLRAEARTTGALAEAVDLGRFTVMQHLKVLREAQLVIVETRGRKRVNHLNAVPIQRIHERWVSQYESNWAAALVGLQETLERREPSARGQARRQRGHDVG